MPSDALGVAMRCYLKNRADSEPPPQVSTRWRWRRTHSRHDVAMLRDALIVGGGGAGFVDPLYCMLRDYGSNLGEDGMMRWNILARLSFSMQVVDV